MLSDEKSRPRFLAVLAGVLASIFFLLYIFIPLLVSGIMITSTLMVDDPKRIQQLVDAIDEARNAYIREQVEQGYFIEKDPNGNAYKNTVFQWKNGISKNDREIITLATCYYQEDWTEYDFTALCQLLAVRSISFSTTVTGPYACAGCQEKYVCDGHAEETQHNAGRPTSSPAPPAKMWYHDSLFDPGSCTWHTCDNCHVEPWCPGMLNDGVHGHYDLYVTGAVLGWAGRTVTAMARAWDRLTTSTQTDSKIAEQYLTAFLSVQNPAFAGWTDTDIAWANNVCDQDWKELYGIVIDQIGITEDSTYDLTDGDHFSNIGSLIVPIKSYSRISTWFGDADAIYNKPHQGMDFAAAMGTSILAAGDGIVVSAGWHNQWGNYVKIYNGQISGHEVYTLYAHASTLYVSAGERVTQGQRIAAVGSTGASTGCHLHFEVYVDSPSTSSRVDPAPWIGMSR